jgi:DNA-binding PadR family transcriptional regulator
MRALLDIPSGESYGFELAELTGLASGTIYPILRRLESDGLVRHRWDLVQTEGQRRRRRYYALTPEGHRVAQAETSQHRVALRLLAPGLPATI